MDNKEETIEFSKSFSVIEDKNLQTIQSNNVRAEIFRFENGSEVSEYHVMLHVTDATLTFEQQLDAIFEVYDDIRRRYLSGARAVFKRYFLSDSANQSDYIYARSIDEDDCALSVVEQAPLDGSKVALWSYLMTGMTTTTHEDGLYEALHGMYHHFWLGSSYNLADNSEKQTTLLLNNYVLQLIENKMTLADNCVRTWFFVNDIDNNYAGVVKGRNDVFMTQNLTTETHYISSTGIGGRQNNHSALVQMDAYAVRGIKEGQMKYLYALDNLNRTSDYGVAFERGTYVDYGDRRQVFISGTASINNRGDVVYPGNIVKQTRRMWANVEALLKEADMTFENIGQMCVYLRDPADYQVVRAMFDRKFSGKPFVILHAPVCRPGWLIEMECMGVKQIENSEYAPF